MPKHLRILPQKCSGCRSCELVCSLVNESELNPSKSRIVVINFLEGGYQLPFNLPLTCKHCADAPCMNTCPTGAILRSKDRLKAILIEHELCTHCGHCVKACPFGAMLFNKEKREPFKCELCGGEPACLSICPNEAILFVQQRPFYAQPKALQNEAFLILSKRNQDSLKRS